MISNVQKLFTNILKGRFSNFIFRSRATNLMEEKQTKTNNSNSSSDSSETKYSKMIFGAGVAFVAGSAISYCMDEAKTRNSLQKRVNITQFAANEPCEDTFSAYQLVSKNIQSGYYAAVFDGHGGWQLAEYAKKTLHKFLQEDLEESNYQNIPKSIENAFDKIESKFLEFSQMAFEFGYPKVAYVGACALVSLVVGDKLYVGNAGDCKAVILRKNKNGGYTPIKASKTFSANKKSEQKRLKEEFKDEEDIVKCHQETSCYVKGSLMPSRSLGDFRLKFQEFNELKYPINYGYRKPLKKYTGKYITHKPDIKEFKLTKDDKYLILGSDGLWDELSFIDTCKIFQENEANVDDLSKKLFESAINVVSKKYHISTADIIEGNFIQNRRDVHDDITIVVVDLSDQVS